MTALWIDTAINQNFR